MRDHLAQCVTPREQGRDNLGDGGDGDLVYFNSKEKIRESWEFEVATSRSLSKFESSGASATKGTALKFGFAATMEEEDDE